MGLQRRLRGVYMGAPYCKVFLDRKFAVVAVRSWPKMAVFRELRGVNVNFYFVF